jgi:hypothetical protein
MRMDIPIITCPIIARHSFGDPSKKDTLQINERADSHRNHMCCLNVALQGWCAVRMGVFHGNQPDLFQEKVTHFNLCF